MALSPERQSARMSKIKNGGLDQYGAEPFKQQQFGPAGVERVKENIRKVLMNYGATMCVCTVNVTTIAGSLTISLLRHL